MPGLEVLIHPTLTSAEAVGAQMAHWIVLVDLPLLTGRREPDFMILLKRFANNMGRDHMHGWLL